MAGVSFLWTTLPLDFLPWPGGSTGKITVNLGYRTTTIPYRDERPAGERASALVVGDRVSLTGSPIEHAAVADIVVDGELAHPERLQAYVERAIAQRTAR
jgi:hypothetical protein